MAEALAAAVADGAKTTGSEVAVIEAGALDGAGDFDLLFIGTGSYAFGPDHAVIASLSSPKLSGRRVAVFCVHSGGGKAVLAKMASLAAAAGALESGSLSIPLRGILKHIGKGNLQEIDLVRARAFGERTCNKSFGLRVAKDNEKQRIKGYEKQ